MSKPLRFRDQTYGNSLPDSGAIKRACYSSRKRLQLLWLAVPINALAFLVPTNASAQVCRSNIDVGCLKAGAVCSPVEVGVGPSGHCTTPAGQPKGERECNCIGMPVTRPPDPCSDRTAKGKLECIIDEPVVTQHETEYPKIVFAPGDTVVVHADGCVQTGGSGKTWKRYVDPSGPKSDWLSDPSHKGLYHGLISIPGATPGDYLVRIGDIVKKNLKVKDVAGVLSLHLGYEDDNYSDNGYYSHDDGTEDQCKNVGPAQVRITIFRGIAPPPPESTFDFNLEWDSKNLDPNGFPLNPHWTWQGRPENHAQIPSTSLCHNFSKVDSVVSSNAGQSIVWGPSFSDCTDQTDMNHLDTGGGVSGFICGFSTSNNFHGHINWFPVTVTGQARWGDNGFDDDYTFGFRFSGALCDSDSTDRSGNRLSVNGRCGLHAEFDAGETIEHFHVKQWTDLRHAVDSWKDAKGEKLLKCRSGPCDITQLDSVIAARKTVVQSLFDGDTILTGMFGLDGEHDLKAEVHPVFAMATKLDSHTNPSDEVWLIFVRNFGDEGFCSSRTWDAPFRHYTVRLPWRTGMRSVEPLFGANQSEFEGTDGTAGPSVTIVPPGSGFPAIAGVYLTFTLPFPAQQPLIDGVLHLKWKPPVVLQSEPNNRVQPSTGGEGNRPGASQAAVTDEDDSETDEVEHKLLEIVNKLPQAQRQAVLSARTSVRRNLHPLSRSGPARVVMSPPPFPRIAVDFATRATMAKEKLARDTAQIRALCAATNNAPPDLPAEVCK